ncbi:TetR/AcrR family transcriptional regulator [Pokkaliibacter sp. CJK22405]|uniref:TetR/AcrR family transcriptional regulator n=1 Tax=Pokkaliibacter sp. CJK22405 TaxID=3384615 RepID=UPI003984B4FE
MSSHSKTQPPARRVPRQERAERRIRTILDSAEQIFVRDGYQKATMTAIAELAATSIGSLYQYFPDKAAVALALRKHYAEEMASRWSAIEQSDSPEAVKEQEREQEEAAPHSDSVEALVDAIIRLMTDFLDEHPAYLLLQEAPLNYQRDPDARLALRERLGELLVQRRAAIQDNATLTATVMLQIVKSLIPLYRDADQTRRLQIIREYRLALLSYLLPPNA